ncbi:DeoR/GlpR transcriptional regulator, partial [Lactobacillus sp. XV13L]|nr:DeoR/GlpR transcriptional regulator [Lactobacillus sp. XV13L]
DNIDLYTIGGSLNKNNVSFETQNIEFYNFYNADYAIISPSGIDIKCGITDYNASIAKMLNIFILRSKHTLIVADHSKLDSVSTFSVSPLNNIYGIITDNIKNKETWIKASNQNSFFIKETGV